MALLLDGAALLSGQTNLYSISLANRSEGDKNDSFATERAVVIGEVALLGDLDQECRGRSALNIGPRWFHRLASYNRGDLQWDVLLKKTVGGS